MGSPRSLPIALGVLETIRRLEHQRLLLTQFRLMNSSREVQKGFSTAMEEGRCILSQLLFKHAPTSACRCLSGAEINTPCRAPHRRRRNDWPHLLQAGD